MIKSRNPALSRAMMPFSILTKMQDRTLNKLYVFEGSKPIEVPELHAGDIGAIGKLDKARTGDTLSTKANTDSVTAKIEVSIPYTYKTLPCKETKGTKIR